MGYEEIAIETNSLKLDLNWSLGFRWLKRPYNWCRLWL